MPTNLPPEYFEVERRYRAAESASEKIACLEELLSTVPKHKGTDKLRADLRRKLSKLRAESKARTGATRRESAFLIERAGAGQVVVVGPPNTGKSALVATLTNAGPEVSPSPFSTWTPTPGMMPFADVQIQLIDTPPLHSDFVQPELMDLIRRSDLILLVLDLQADPIRQLEDTMDLLAAHHILPHWLQDDRPEGGRATVKPLLVVANKADDEDSNELVELFRQLVGEQWPVFAVSATSGRNLEQLKAQVFDRLEVIRVYSKPPGREPDLAAPFVLKRGSTVEELAGKIHQDFRHNLLAARVWGSAEFDGQMVPREHVLADGDVVELRI
jgi:ribosome-interacting GTPase 1